MDSCALAWHQFQLEDAEQDQELRVLVCALGGTRIGHPGVGEGRWRLTFPRNFRVSRALRAPQGWIRFATAEELAECGTWYRRYEHPVSALVYSNGRVAVGDEPLGLVPVSGACMVTALPAAPSGRHAHGPAEQHEVEIVSSGPSTPSTPSGTVSWDSSGSSA